MSDDIQWEEVEPQWEEVKPEGKSKAGKVLDNAAHSAFRTVAGPHGEAAANFVTGIPAALGGGLTYLGTLLASQDPKAALAVKQAVEGSINDKLQYQPTSELGKKATEDLNKGMEKIIEGGGHVFGNTIRGIPLIGDTIADDMGKDALEATGKAFTEMALNVAPIHEIGGLVKRGKGEAGLKTEHAAKLEEPKWEEVTPTKQNGATDRGVPPSEANPQGDLFSREQAAPTNPIPTEGQGDLFNGMPKPPAEPTMAHADDFGVVNPYDVGGHVSELKAGRESLIDNAQDDLLGGRTLEGAQPHPRGDGVIIPENFISYTKEFPFGLEPLNKPRTETQMGINMPETDPNIGIVPKESNVAPMQPEVPVNTYEKGNIGSRDAARAKLVDQAREELASINQQRAKDWQKEEAYTAIHSRKEAEYHQMVAQRELEFAKAIDEVENSTSRNFFTDRNNREKVVRPEDSVARSFFLDPKNMDKVDYQFAGDVVGDKTLMAHEHTVGMVDALSRGDVHGVLDTISKNHENAAYRQLADYLKGKLDGIRIKLHDEGILEMGDRHATGYYDPTTKVVGFSKVGAQSPHTVLHELVHAMTSDFVNARPNDLRVMGLKDLYTKLSDMGMQKEFPNIVNIKEFLAESFSNPEFQQFLKEHRIHERSTWRRFVDNVKSILGFSSATRNRLTDALEHTLDLGKQVMEAGTERGQAKAALTDAGMPSKLADLMVTRKKPNNPINVKYGEDVQRLKVPGLTGPISDFTFFDKPIEEIKKMALEADDIPSTMLEKLSHQLQAGGLFESLKTRNPVVKYTYERVTRATQEAARLVKENLTHPETGLVPRMRDLTPDQKGEIHAMMMLHEGQRELSTQELRAKGFSEKQIAYYNKYREVDNSFFNDINEVRANLGMKPIDKRVAHIAGRFMGDFSRFVFNKDGKRVGRIAGSTKWELDKISKYIADNHPEWELGQHEYNRLGRGKAPADRFGGLMEAINFISHTDADAAKLFESYRAYMQKDAIGYLNAVRHAKAKVKEAGGLVGSEGNKPWLDTVKNAEQGMKAQIAYFEQGYAWMAMEKAVHDLKPLIGDEEVVLNQKNATNWAQQYVDHALGRNQGKLADAANWTASMIGQFSGVGHSNLFKASNLVKHAMMQKFMGLLNIPFSITQLMQPLQVHPSMIMLLKQRGLEFSATKAQLDAVNTHFKMVQEEHGRPVQYSAFEKEALKYAKDMGILDVKMADHTKNINESKLMENYHKLADLNITIPERLTRGTSFLFYSHLLKDAGIPTKDIFGAAENMTNMTMVNYHPIERPMGYAKLGWIGDVASTLTRYKHNQASQMAFYTRNGIMGEQGLKSYAPMATFLSTSLAFGGVMGFFGFNEADSAYQLATEWLGKPDTLTNVLFSHNTPEIISHGVFSMLGLDMTTRFSNANLIPDNIGAAMMPYGSAALDIAKSTGRFAINPSEFTFKQLVKSVAPQSVQGIVENTMFTDKQPDGRNLYVNSTDGPNLGKGRVYRSDTEMAGRMLGFRSLRESKELAKNYSDSQIEKGNANVVDRILTNAKRDALAGNLTNEKLQEYVARAAKLGESPDGFISKFTTWQRDRHLSQEQQQSLKNAMGGFRGAVNIKEGR